MYDCVYVVLRGVSATGGLAPICFSKFNNETTLEVKTYSSFDLSSLGKKLYEPKNNADNDPKGAQECKEIQWGDSTRQNLRNSRGALFYGHSLYVWDRQVEVPTFARHFPLYLSPFIYPTSFCANMAQLNKTAKAPNLPIIDVARLESLLFCMPRTQRSVPDGLVPLVGVCCAPRFIYYAVTVPFRAYTLSYV